MADVSFLTLEYDSFIFPFYSALLALEVSSALAVPHPNVDSHNLKFKFSLRFH